MKLFYFSLSLILFSLNFNHAQEEFSNKQTLVSNANQLYSFDRSDKTIQGTPYINEDFSPARVSAQNTKILNVRYNAVTDEIEVETDKNSIQAVNKHIKNIAVTFLKDNKSYQAINYINKEGNDTRGYFICLTNSNSPIRLLLKESKKFIKRKPAKTGYQTDKPAQFKRLDDEYYIVINEENAQKIPKKVKNLSKQFPNNTNEINNYIKSNKIKISKKVDLIKLTNFLNTL